MKLQSFRVLDAVLRNGTLAAAAQECNLTASAVSLQIKGLEQFVGQPLFDRSGLQVKALPLAHQVARIMLRAHAELDAVRRPESIRVAGAVHLGMVESLQPLLLPGILTRLRQDWPAVQLHMRRGKSSELQHAVKAGELDAAVISQPENGGSSRLHWHALMQQSLSLIVPPAETETSMQRLFARYEWIRYDTNTIVGRQAARYVHAHTRARRGNLELDAIRAILALVARGLGVSVVQLAEPTLAHGLPVRVIPLPDAPRIQSAFVSRPVDVDKRVLAAVRECVVATVDSLDLPDGSISPPPPPAAAPAR
ncbi:LysR family transcriptional regulator [Xylophilus sp. GOD-11R]|uniref:LysR family transcriptional regulator n=1 Tax=Xylophilus sp. GOD-11R TaxID=3089814 RepID=UPI00298C32D6|nr:LysR family transcriptional regulator [Xylophilus sp. GOD-11R]WPB57311.1 LysR family transcriptional regulator [Xylophilus sp. GOD-11R]